MNLLPCIELEKLIINYMTQLTIYFFLNNFLCVFDKCGLFTLAIFSNSVSGFLLEGRGWKVESRYNTLWFLLSRVEIAGKIICLML